LRLANPSNDAPASIAGFATAIVNHKLQLKIAWISSRITKIPQCGSSLFQSFLQNFFYCGSKFFIALCRNTACRPRWMNACRKKRLICIYIPNTDHNSAVHEKFLHCQGPSPGLIEEILPCQAIFQGLFAEILKKRVLHGRAAGPKRTSETTSVIETQQFAVAHQQIEVIVLLDRSVLRADQKSSRHSQVHDDSTCFSLNQQILCPPAHGDNLPARKASAEIIGNRPSEIRVTNNNSCYCLADQFLLDAPSDRFNFGQFRHCKVPFSSTSPE